MDVKGLTGAQIDEKIDGLPERLRKKLKEDTTRILSDKVIMTIDYNLDFRTASSIELQRAIFIKNYLQFLPRPGGMDGEEGEEAYRRMFKRYGGDRTA